MAKLEGKRPLGRSRHMWVGNIKKDLKEMGRGDVDGIDLAQDVYHWRAPCDHGIEHFGSIKCWKVLE
jgi:hypothetical protein